MGKIFIISAVFLSTVFFESDAGKTLQNADVIVIKNGNVLDVEKMKVLEETTVVVEGGKIVSVGKLEDQNIPDGAKIIEADGKWIVPGLVDSHIHLFQSGGIYTRPDVINLQEYIPYEEERQWLRNQAEDILQRYLKAGVTTVIDVGGPKYNLKIRDEQNNSATPTAKLFLTGPLASTYQPDAFKVEDAPIRKVNNPQDAINLVREQLPLKPDFIKIWYIVGRGQNG